MGFLDANGQPPQLAPVQQQQPHSVGSILDQVSNKVQQEGQRIVIAGQEKVGKTTFSCMAPKALLIPLELGYGAIPVAKTPMLTTWAQVVQLCEELRTRSQQGRLERGSSIVWDSATALEKLIHEETIANDPDIKAGKTLSFAPTMETVHGGYGKAYPFANNLFYQWLRYQDELAKYGGINIVVTCHVFAARVVDPAYGEYDSWDLQLHSPKNQKTFGKREAITQWADMVGFMHEPLFVLQTEKGQHLQKAISSNQGRMLAVDRAPSWTAGNRYNMSGVISIPKEQSWNYLADTIYRHSGIDVYNKEL